MGSIEFRDSVDCPLLQCADLLAYEMYKEADRKLSESARASRRSFLALLRDGDRLTAIDPDTLKRSAEAPVRAIFAIVNLLPPRERFQVLCYGLRSITDTQREALFEAAPHFARIYALCLACGEMGKRLDELPPEVLPPDDPNLLIPLMDLLSADTEEEGDPSLNP